ncbi:MAG: hypothetical protein RL329_2469 [Bacteroidota bacterium]|jgi:predicted nuclease of restriction endonuclease-like (RecB) superfamily
MTTLYEQIAKILQTAQKHAYLTVNKVMLEAYWSIGEKIVKEEQVGNERAAYGDKLLKTLSHELTKEFGTGFHLSNLQYMRQFYLTFPIHHALRGELTWTHYRYLLKVKNGNAQQYYLSECIENQWSTRALERQINSLYYERLLISQDRNPVLEGNKQLFVSKYKLYLPTEEELRIELEREKRLIETENKLKSE